MSDCQSRGEEKKLMSQKVYLTVMLHFTKMGATQRLDNFSNKYNLFAVTTTQSLPVLLSCSDGIRM